MNRIGPSLLLLALALAPSRAGADDAAAGVVRQATEKLQGLIRDHHEEYGRQRAKFEAIVDETLAPVFDVPALSQAALGLPWRSATAEQRARFQAAFKKTLISAYSTALLAFSDSVKLQWLASTTDGAGTHVRADIVRASGPPIGIGFDLHPVAGAWKIYDIKVDQVSLITGFKSQYVAEVRRSGLDALIHRLEGGAPPAAVASDRNR